MYLIYMYCIHRVLHENNCLEHMHGDRDESCYADQVAVCMESILK